MKKIFFTLVVALLVTPVVVGAACPNGMRTVNGVCVPTSGQTGLSEASFFAVIGKVTNFITGLIAVLAILMIVISGIMYITSAGDSGRAEDAKKYLTMAVTGLVVALLAFVIVTAVGSALGAW